jgi:hypothetical protein
MVVRSNPASHDFLLLIIVNVNLLLLLLLLLLLSAAASLSSSLRPQNCYHQRLLYNSDACKAIKRLRPSSKSAGFNDIPGPVIEGFSYICIPVPKFVFS